MRFMNYALQCKVHNATRFDAAAARCLVLEIGTFPADLCRNSFVTSMRLLIYRCSFKKRSWVVSHSHPFAFSFHSAVQFPTTFLLHHHISTMPLMKLYLVTQIADPGCSKVRPSSLAQLSMYHSSTAHKFFK